MKQLRGFSKRALSYLLTLTLIMSMVFTFSVSVSASGTSISYQFSGSNSADSGYAQGKITLSSDTDGTYYLYWADDTKALSGYYEIAKLVISGGKSASFEFGDHTAIPAGATKIIAVNSKANLLVSGAKAVYSIPQSKQLNAGKLLYTFNSYSDVHIDTQGYYVNAEKNWKQALKFAVDKDTDFIVSSGDMVTNAGGPDSEWDVYERVLANSDYVNPVWESDGNHDMRCGVSSGLKSFVKASGTDSTIANYDANKPYYYVTEQSTGDIFIFMALENDSNPSKCDEFSSAQMSWLTNLLSRYYGTGVNIYIIEHSPIKGFGAGDRMSNPYYKAHLSESYTSTVQFKNLLKKYPKLIWMSGHTHEDYTMGYNYSNENGTACHMIHNPAVAGSTWAEPSATSLDYNDGVGYNSQGYYVEAYENQVVYYGANLTDELIYPAYCYIMDSSRNASPDETNPTDEEDTKPSVDETGPTGSVIPEGTETQRVYFANTLKWQYIDCYSWSTDDVTTCVWPGYGAKYYGTSEQGVDLYYCDIPKAHENVIWNNAGNDYQTVDITLDGVNNFFTPSSTSSSKAVPVNASVWEYNPVTEPTTSTEPVTEAPLFKTGDVNKDGEVGADDATEIQRYIAEYITLTDEQLVLGDVNFSNTVNIIDATLIQKYTANLIPAFTNNSTNSKAVNEVSENNAKPKTVNEVSAKSAEAVGASTLSETLTLVKQNLDVKYNFSSYNQYQALKKYYYQYKNKSSVSNEQEVVAEFDRLTNELNTIAEHIGALIFYPVGDVYYFENTNNWSTVYCYAWNGSSKNAEWPGAKMQKVGSNYGHDVYGVKFEYAGQFTNLIFSNGSEQTVDVMLNNYENNCFCLDGKSSGGKLTVGNFKYEAGTEPTVATTPTKPVTDNNHYALCYYNGTAHGWSTIDTFFSSQSDGTYALDFTANNSENISLNVYDNSASKYNCVSASASLTFTSDATESFSLVSSSSRGKSLTVKGVSTGDMLRFVYNPTDNTLSITCKGSGTVEPTEAPTQPATSADSDTTYVMYIAPAQSSVNSGCTFKANIKDSANTYHSYTFVKTDETYNGVAVYKAEITNPSFTDTVKIQYQTWDSSGTFVGQVVVEKSAKLSSYNNTIMVCSSATSGSLKTK